MVDTKEKSIIELIQAMVAKGETEDKIIETLTSLGIEEDKARRLLLISEADTFALLRSEISNIAKKDVEENMPILKKFIEERTAMLSNENLNVIERDVKKELTEFENKLVNIEHGFEENVKANLKKIADITSKVDAQVESQEKRIKSLELDLDEMRMRGVSGKTTIPRILLILFGIGFLVGAAGIILTSSFVVEVVLGALIVALIGTTCLFTSTVI